MKLNFLMVLYFRHIAYMHYMFKNKNELWIRRPNTAVFDENASV